MTFKEWLFEKAIQASELIWPDEFATRIRDAHKDNSQIHQNFLEKTLEKAGQLPPPE